MTHRDRGIVAVLGGILVALAVLVALPGAGADVGITLPGASQPAASPSPTGAPGSGVVYREGTVGRPSSINPLTARTQADRDLVALIFSGLVSLGPDGTYQPDLAESWTVDAKGKTWTFRLRPDATWQDGVPVTADDVVFTVGILKSPDYTGPLAQSWRGVEVAAVDDRTVQFTLDTPIGGFLEAATIGLLPAHLLSDAPVQTLADDPFNLQPVGSGPFVLTAWNAGAATLVPASMATTPAEDPGASAPPGPASSTIPSPSASDVASATATPAPSPSPTAGRTPRASGTPKATASPRPTPTPVPTPAPTPIPDPQLPGIHMTFFQDAAALADAYRAGDLDAAAGLPPDVADQLATLPHSRVLSYPRTTLTAIALNLRTVNAELRNNDLRHGLLASIDRNAIIATVFGGAATRADSPIPPSSWAFDRKASKPVKFDLKRATADLKAAGWKRLAGGWAAPGTKKPYVMELIAPDAASNATAMAVAEAVAADWRRFGLQTTVTSLSPAQFVGDRLTVGKFQSAAVDVNIGLDPDLYPLFGSTQVARGGSNFTGIQDVSLDRALNKARAPGSLAARKAAFSLLQTRLVSRDYMLPIAFRNELVVLSDRVQGPVVRELADPSDRFWDVLTWRLAGGG